MNLVLLTKVMSLTGKIRTVKSSRYGSTYYTSYQRSRRERPAFSRTHYNFILFCFAFATTDEMREDLFWQWIEHSHLFSREQKETILNLRTQNNENMHSLGFLDLSENSTLRYIMTSALGSLTYNIGDFLNSSLEWARTPQGHDFWMELNRRFVQCWHAIIGALANPSFSEAGILDLRSAMAANISARLVARNELMNRFFFNYDAIRQLRREERDRQLRDAREEARQAMQEVQQELEQRGAEMEYTQRAVTADDVLSQEDINRMHATLRGWNDMYNAQSRLYDIASSIENIRAPVDHEVVFPEVTTAANTATSPMAEQGTTPIAGQGTTSHAEPRVERRLRWSFIDPFGPSGGTDNH